MRPPHELASARAPHPPSRGGASWRVLREGRVLFFTCQVVPGNSLTHTCQQRNALV